MKSLLATLCLTIAVLLGSAGVGYALPPCPEKGLFFKDIDTKDQCYGTKTWANGEKYVGEWKGGKRHGQGTYIYAQGQIKKGTWKDGTFEGSDQKLIRQCLDSGITSLSNQAPTWLRCSKENSRAFIASRYGPIAVWSYNIIGVVNNRIVLSVVTMKATATAHIIGTRLVSMVSRRVCPRICGAAMFGKTMPDQTMTTAIQM